MRRFLLALWILAPLALLAQERAPRMRRQGPPQLIRSTALRAHPDSDFQFDEGSVRLYILKTADGLPGKAFSYQISQNANTSVSWVMPLSDLNEQDGTYKARRVPDEEMENLDRAKAQVITTQPETPQLDEADIPPQHQHAKGEGATWTTTPEQPIGGVGVDLAPPPDGCPCLGQECSFSVTAWEGTQNSFVPHPKYTRTLLTGSAHRFVNNLQRCQFSSTGGIGYYTVYSWPGAHFKVNPALPPHQEGPHTWGVLPSHWDMTAVGDYRCDDCPNTWSEDKVVSAVDTDAVPQLVTNGYHADYGETAGALEGYGSSTFVSSCEQ